MGENVGRRTVECDAALIDYDDAVAILGEQRDRLLDEDDGHPRQLLGASEYLEHIARARGIERGGGFVHDDDTGCHGEDGGDGDLLLLTAGKRRDFAMAQVGDAHGVEGRCDAPLDLAVVDAEVLEAEQQLVLHDGGHHLSIDVLEDRAGDLGYIGEGRLADVESRHECGAKQAAPIMVGDGAGDDARQRRLSGTRGADQADEGALFDGEVDVLEGVGAVSGGAVGERDALHFDDRAHRAPFSVLGIWRCRVGRMRLRHSFRPSDCLTG